jgi:type IV fimbrial biogenesis protein FimT
MKNVSAFTLIELLIAISIMAILLLISIPSVYDLVVSNRTTAEVNNIISALQFARNEAIRNGVPVKFCKSINHKTCGGNWQDGQIVINESNNEIFRVFLALPKGDNLTWNSSLGKEDYIEFSAIGSTNGQHGTFSYCPNGEKKYARAIIISQAGRIRVADKLPDGSNILCD